MSGNVSEYKILHQVRKGIYSFFNKVYLMHPGEKLYRLIDEVLPELCMLAENSDDKDIIDSAQQIKVFMDERKALNGEQLAEFELEALRKYTSLLCLATSVPAVESYYISPGKLLMQESRDKILALFRKYQLGISESINEYEDHISIELSFMAKIAEESILAIDADNMNKYRELLEEQVNFHKNHFDKWIPQFAERIYNDELSRGEVLYNALTRYLQGFLREDTQTLMEISGD